MKNKHKMLISYIFLYLFNLMMIGSIHTKGMFFWNSFAGWCLSFMVTIYFINKVRKENK